MGFYRNELVYIIQKLIITFYKTDRITCQSKVQRKSVYATNLKIVKVCQLNADEGRNYKLGYKYQMM